MKPGDGVELLDVVVMLFTDDTSENDLVFRDGHWRRAARSARARLKRKVVWSMVVLYGARTPDDFCYRDETDDWEKAGVELRQVISRPDGHDWSGPTGYVQSLLDHVLPDLKSPIALICGSQEMISQTRDRLLQMGFAREEILTNY